MNTKLLSLTPTQFCEETHACQEGALFATKKHPTMRSVWEHCPRTDWMCWILNALDVPPDEKAVRLYMVWCARNTPMADGRVTGTLLTNPRSTEALDAAEGYANGTVSADQLSAARSAARSAAWSAARSAQADQFRLVVPNPFP